MAETVSVDDAARALGITPNATRKRLRAGTLDGSKDARGSWRIPIDSLPPGPEVAPPVPEEAPQDRHQDRAAETQLLRAELGHARETIARLDETVTEQRDTIRELRGAVTGLTALSAIQRQPRLAAWWGRVRGRGISA